MVPSIYGENMFDDFFDGSFFGGHSPLFGKHARNLMKTDIRETDDAKAYRFAVELPGFEKDEIHVDVQDGYLTVSAEKGLDKDEENKKGRVLRQERYSGACSRSFYVGDVKPEDVKAKYESGVLTVLIPKEEPKKLTSSSKIAIESVNRKGGLPSATGKADRLFLSRGGYGSMVKTLFQASTWNALALGNFDTVISVRELLRCADTGVGIGTALDGVITFENGAAYKTAPDGEVTVMRPEDSMAFAAAMVFDENAPEIALNGIDDLTSLKQMLAPFVQGNPNLFYMIKAGGVFKTMHTQSWNSCRKPYPVLSEAAKSRNEFCFENTRGNVIAVWCPRYVDGICIPDWHFHYLSSDKTQGGHILDLSAERLHLKINRIGRFDLLLPQTTEFAHCELREGKSAAAERFAACQATADKLL